MRSARWSGSLAARCAGFASSRRHVFERTVDMIGRVAATATVPLARAATRVRVPTHPARFGARVAIFDLYAGFASEGGRTGAMRLRTILRLAEDLGIAAPTAKAAATRVVRKKLWLGVRRTGRESLYVLTADGPERNFDRRER